MSRTVSIVVPCRNEGACIDAFCAGVLAQVLPKGWSLELVIADGCSDDGTRERLTALAAADRRIAWIDNPQRIVSTGLNLAIARSSGDIIVRMDVHTDYATDYVAECIAALQATSADNVGGPWHAQPVAHAAPMQHAIAAAFQSRWVTGGAASRRLAFDGWVDTVYLGCWPRATFDRFGLFDETLVRNQDDEHNLRIHRGGGRVWQSSRIHSIYRPRARLVQVFRQYLQYGYWKPFVMRKHGQIASWRQLAPAALVAGGAVLTVVSVLTMDVWPIASWLAAYALTVAAMTAAVAVEGVKSTAVVWRLPAVIAAYHVAYGLGSLLGGWDAWQRARGRERFAMLSR